MGDISREVANTLVPAKNIKKYLGSFVIYILVWKVIFGVAEKGDSGFRRLKRLAGYESIPSWGLNQSPVLVDFFSSSQ